MAVILIAFITVLNIIPLVNTGTPFLDDAAFGIVDVNLKVDTKSIAIGTGLTINRGSSYDTTDGVFTAPLSGTYVMFTHAVTVPGTTELVLLFQNPVASGVIASGASELNTIFKSIVVHLDKGDEIKVMVRGGKLEATDSTPFLFNCFLLYHDCIDQQCHQLPVRQSAFSAVVTKPIPEGPKVIDNYGVILANTGDDFVMGTGLFHVRLEGLYYLSVAVVLDNDVKTTKIDLEVNGKTEGRVRARTSETQEVAGIGIIKYLKKGDVVRLVNIATSPKVDSPKYINLCFTGFLL